MSVCFVDCETTGLDPDRHEIWEVGLIADEGTANGGWTERRWLLPVDLGRADPIALRIGGFHERHPQGDDYEPVSGQLSRGESDAVGPFAQAFARLTRGAHLVGAVVSFDEERLRRLLRANGACPEWHYHLVDVEALAAGKLGIRPPWNSETLSLAVGVDPAEFARHAALGDARWAKAIYEAVIGK